MNSRRCSHRLNQLAAAAALLAVIAFPLSALAGIAPLDVGNEYEPESEAHFTPVPVPVTCHNKAWVEVPCGTPLAMFCAGGDGPAACAARGYSFPGVEEGSYCLDEFCVATPSSRRR